MKQHEQNVEVTVHCVVKSKEGEAIGGVEWMEMKLEW